MQRQREGSWIKEENNLVMYNERSIMRPEWLRKASRGGILPCTEEFLKWVKNQEFKLDRGGVRILRVVEGSPAFEVGIKQDDIIESINGNIVDSNYVSGYMVEKNKGEPITVVVRQEGREKKELVIAPAFSERLGIYTLGFSMEDVVSSNRAKEEHRDVKSGSFAVMYEGPKGETYKGFVDIRENEQGEFELKHMVIMYTDKDGHLMRVDLLARWNTSAAKIIINPELDTSGIASEYENKIEMRNPFVSTAPLTLAHELRHLMQGNDPSSRLAGVGTKYVGVGAEKYQDEDRYQALMKRNNLFSLATCLWIGGVVDTKEIGVRLLDKWKEQFKAVETARLLLRQADVSADKKELERALKDAFENLPKATDFAVEGLTFIDVLRLPTLVLERDAVYGSLIALRQLKKETGIDLLGKRADRAMILNPDSYQMEECKLPVERLRLLVPILGKIHDYLSSIGVDEGCLRKKRIKKKKSVVRT